LFLDVPGDAAWLFAIHNIVQAGIQYDKLPGKHMFIRLQTRFWQSSFVFAGEWFGPSTAALAMRYTGTLSCQHRSHHRHLYHVL
jgi:predicted phosphohydrolase